MNKLCVFLADDHAVVREGLRSLVWYAYETGIASGLLKTII
jgi:hypothetical protein